MKKAQDIRNCPDHKGFTIRVAATKYGVSYYSVELWKNFDKVAETSCSMDQLDRKTKELVRQYFHKLGPNTAKVAKRHKRVKK